ncbi:MAG: DUF1080 domain-containing protein [Pirellulaceae bacterium]|nr:DUF1080 domain-containing protein [Pirellulaceae bacterium]
MRQSLSILSALLALHFGAATLLGANPPKPGSKTAVIDPALADADFAIQGEYSGSANIAGRGYERVGLQVVALGDGKFDAVRFRGGLPGGGWDQQSKVKLTGQSESGSVLLTGEDGKISLTGPVAIVQDASGREIGRLVKVERTSSTMGLPAPAGATVLFAGQATPELPGAKLTPDGLLLAGVLTKKTVGPFRLHLEFRTPYMPYARGQARGNSGVYIQQRYEVQILDSFGLEGIENECGGLYRQRRPDLNMCLPPLTWQTYDIWFTPPQFAADGKTKLANAWITVLHNGVTIHNREIIAKTGGGKQEGPDRLPINLQDHGNPVTFRNIWIVDLAQPQPSASSGSCCEPRCQRGWLRRHRRCR